MLLAFAYTATALTNADCSSAHIQANITALTNACICSKNNPATCGAAYCSLNYGCYQAGNDFYAFASACQVNAEHDSTLDISPLNSTAWMDVVNVFYADCLGKACLTSSATEVADRYNDVAANCGGSGAANALANICYYNSIPATTLDCQYAVETAASEGCYGLSSSAGSFTGSQWKYVLDNWADLYNTNCTGSCSAPSTLEASFIASRISRACGSCNTAAGSAGCATHICSSTLSTDGIDCYTAIEEAANDGENCVGLGDFSSPGWSTYLIWNGPSGTPNYYTDWQACSSASTGSTGCQAATAAADIKSSCGLTTAITAGTTAAAALAGLCVADATAALNCYTAFDTYGFGEGCRNESPFTDASWAIAFDYLNSGGYDTIYNNCHQGSTGGATCDASAANAASQVIAGACGCSITSDPTSCLAGLCVSATPLADACYQAFLAADDSSCSGVGPFTGQWTTALNFDGTTTASYDFKYNSCPHTYCTAEASISAVAGIETDCHCTFNSKDASGCVANACGLYCVEAFSAVASAGCVGQFNFSDNSWISAFTNLEATLTACDGVYCPAYVAQGQQVAIDQACHCTSANGAAGCVANVCNDMYTENCLLELGLTGSAASNCGAGTNAPFNQASWTAALDLTGTTSYAAAFAQCPGCDAVSASATATIVAEACTCDVYSDDPTSCLNHVCEANCYGAFEIAELKGCVKTAPFNTTLWTKALTAGQVGYYQDSAAQCPVSSSTGSTNPCDDSSYLTGLAQTLGTACGCQPLGTNPLSCVTKAIVCTPSASCEAAQVAVGLCSAEIIALSSSFKNVFDQITIVEKSCNAESSTGSHVSAAPVSAASSSFIAASLIAAGVAALL